MLSFAHFTKLSALDDTKAQAGGASSDTLNISKIHFDDLAAAKAAHLHNKLAGKAVEGQKAPKVIKRPELKKVMVEFADGKSDIKVPYAQLRLTNGDTITR